MSQYKAEVFCVDITQTITPSASLDTHSWTHFKTSRSRLSHTIQATISASTPIHTIYRPYAPEKRGRRHL